MKAELRDWVVRDLAAEALRRSSSIYVRNGSWSMSPIIRPGDVLLIARRAPSRLLATGDLLFVATPCGVKLHRLVRIRGWALVTKGDSNPHFDPPCSIDDIVGICVAINGHRIDTPTWRFVNRQIAKISPYSHQLRAPLRLLGRVRRALGLWWL